MHEVLDVRGQLDNMESGKADYVHREGFYG